MVAVPEADGVQRKTRSGAVAVGTQVPASVLGPLVVPEKVPPAAGMSVALPQALAAGGVTVSEKLPDVPL